MSNHITPFVFYRNGVRLSARAFCQKFGFNYSWYLKVESGKISWRNLTIVNFERLSRAYGLSITHLWNQLVIYDLDCGLLDGNEVVNKLVDETDDFWYDQG